MQWLGLMIYTSAEKVCDNYKTHFAQYNYNNCHIYIRGFY